MMNFRNSHSARALYAGVFMLFGAVQASAADFSGAYKGTFTKQDQRLIADNGQHVLVLGTSTGINKSTGRMGYFDGGDIEVNDVVDLVNGNGTHHGYWTVSQKGEQVTNTLNGKVTTVMAPDGKTPITTIEGTLDGLYGTNLNGSIHPVGTYKVTFTSPSEYLCEWQVTGFK